ncbi:MAG: circularly permuted type 2 ATP-grasp protein, partial [Rickettsiales bacterium]|nr:circularly permuted type 2 ATP-grasp protein [Rickettsiales bacterium]
MSFDTYDTKGFFDELVKPDGKPRALAMPLVEQVNALGLKEIRRMQKASELALYQQGVTFSVYGDKKGTEKIMPFDIIPRLVPGDEWAVLEKGLKQRIHALNLFVHDIYNDQKILKDNVVPKEMILSSACYLKQCQGLQPPKRIWIHITGTDLVRHTDGKYYVLEDNLRCPSGISYVLQNRAILKRTFPKAFEAMKVCPVSDYGDHLYDTLKYVSQREENPNVIVLTPG